MGGVRWVRVIDSHSEGEPTRVVIEGAPELTGSLQEKRDQFRDRHDKFRSAVVNEPRGSDAVVGALMLPPEKPDSICGVIFFNNVGYLGMCGHGTMGIVATLAHMGRIEPGMCQIDTPAGTVTAELHSDGRVSVGNVESYRFRTGVDVVTPSLGNVTGDIAYGGNWFFLASLSEDLQAREMNRYLTLSQEIRDGLEANGITGENGAFIDHIELFGPPARPDANSKNFVLCPGLAYDRSPCGTGLSAKLACLAADGKLAPGEGWRQESIIGSLFEGSYQPGERGILPTVTGRAFITAETNLVFEPSDPFQAGIRL